MMRKNRQTRMMVLLGVAAAYALVLALWGSPLLAFTTWMGWVDPQAAR
ncbi:hypothetical protein J2X76_000285 [Neorhizobium sp. 2083]|nr:hypothetical protein [Neorhizobium sp. 2083]MDR6815131.1 hypothetical protein [Neorhizobium sp. 2083]